MNGCRRRLHNKRGVTLIEALLGMALLALVVTPALSVFVATARTNRLAGMAARMDAAASARLERFYMAPYRDALEAGALEIDGFLAVASLAPAGASLGADGRMEVFHIIVDEGGATVVAPDGAYASGEADVRIALTGDSFTMDVGDARSNGALRPGRARLLMIFAAPGCAASVSVNASEALQCHVYADTPGDIDVSGCTVTSMPARDYALCYVKSAARDPDGQLADAVMEGVVPLSLWGDEHE